MKQKKRLLVSSFAMLLVSILTLTSVTYAWFTSGRDATVSGVQFHAEAQEGIQISVGPETAVTGSPWTWGSKIDLAQLNKVAANKTQTDAGTLAPVSTTVAQLKLGKLFQGTVSDTTLTVLDAATSSKSGDTITAGYYAFDLYFKNEGSSAKTIFLDTTDTQLMSKVSPIVDEATDIVDVGLQNATRVAFAVVGSASNATTLSDKTVISESGNGFTASNDVVIWEPNAKVHNDTVVANYGVVNGTAYKYHGVDAVTGPWTLGYVSGGVLGLYKDGSAVEDFVSTNDGAANISLFTVSANETVKITVFIWIEGQDVDCINYASAGHVATNLRFVAEAKTQGSESGGTESGGTESGGTESSGTESGGTESGETESSGTESN